ncbi:MAG: 4Fe-4S dicluster domain-containing protein [Kiritimatiellae bacterium]|jgi:carbon-monoxide dehydrogenase iron sulfur subunit|nr:4Fe-4S dicluster domain-containing protein [Kiritimatiellia bacterium]MDD4342388.1 4Fe-4S dicluster domain-containing protein [Kiritimatiellia bacterium]MDY0148467.1 4Fe-4S dicluster domain-containing protein [Kiritimatiellia bacterium]
MKKLTVTAEDCTGCRRCEQACIAAHSRAGNAALATLEKPEPKSRILIEYDRGPVPLVCRHCVEPLCVSACMAGCMQKDPETGIVNNVGHEQQCVGCWMCIMACPYGVISPSYDAGGEDQSSFAVALKCDLCPNLDTPACVAACPMNVLAVSDVPEPVFNAKGNVP